MLWVGLGFSQPGFCGCIKDFHIFALPAEGLGLGFFGTTFCVRIIRVSIEGVAIVTRALFCGFCLNATISFDLISGFWEERERDTNFALHQSLMDLLPICTY